MQKTAILGATLIDGTGRAPVPDSCVLVEGDKITAVGPRGTVPLAPDVQRVEAVGKTLLPGMIELHSHMYHPAMVQGSGGKESPAYAMVYAANNLRQALQAGITTVREVADMDYVDLSMKRVLAEGMLLGPRLIASGKGICMTGGHGYELEGCVRVANGVDDIRAAVREQVARGVDWCKFLSSHRTQTPEYTQEELSAGIGETHRLGKRAACHAASYASTRMVAVAGVDTIEHGSFMDDETLRIVVDKGIVWVPTAIIKNGIVSYISKQLSDPTLSPAVRPGVQEALDWFTSCVAELPRLFERALRLGVKIGTGTDMIARDYPYACLPEEVEFLVRYGMTPMQAIQAATRVSAEALGESARFGTVEPGKIADLIMVDRDPLADIASLKDVGWVMRGGLVVPFEPAYGRLAGKSPWLALDPTRAEPPKESRL